MRGPLSRPETHLEGTSTLDQMHFNRRTIATSVPNYEIVTEIYIYSISKDDDEEKARRTHRQTASYSGGVLDPSNFVFEPPRR